MPGGEDHVYRDEGWLLEHNGHEVVRYERNNQTIDQFGSLELAKTTIWSRESFRAISDLIRLHRPDIAHFHNTFPLISASAYYAAHRAGVPVVQSMHSFRTVCPGTALLRDHAICEKCVGKRFAWPAVVHKCYRNDRKASAVTAISNAFHHLRGTWRNHVDRFIALTNHSRDKLIEGGVDQRRIAVKPNFVRPDPGCHDPGRLESRGEGAIFVGRLVPEKGIETLLAAWKMLGHDRPLQIVGDGPLRDLVLKAQEENQAIRWLGQLPFDQVLAAIGNARFLAFPSIWYETFGRSMIEAFATGTPVIASDIGSMRELVTDEHTGLHFRAGDPADLAAKAKRLFEDDDLFRNLGAAARKEFEQKFSAEKNYPMLMDIYEQAISQRSHRDT